MDLKKLIRSIEDYPCEGVIFRDITTLLKDKDGFKEAIDKMAKLSEELDYDIIVSPEARGFIVGTPLAYKENKAFVPIRKPGKLPHEVIKKSYELEYGKDTLEVHKDAIKKGDKILFVDDLLATAGTTKAIIEMIEDLGAEVVCCLYLIELSFLDGRKVLNGYDVRTVLKY